MYINEATNEVISRSEKRKGRIPIEKHIMDTEVCQSGKVSEDKIVVYSDDLSSRESKSLNYIGSEDDRLTLDIEVRDGNYGTCS